MRTLAFNGWEFMKRAAQTAQPPAPPAPMVEPPEGAENMPLPGQPAQPISPGSRMTQPQSLSDVAEKYQNQQALMDAQGGNGTTPQPDPSAIMEQSMKAQEMAQDMAIKQHQADVSLQMKDQELKQSQQAAKDEARRVREEAKAEIARVKAEAKSMSDLAKRESQLNAMQGQAEVEMARREAEINSMARDNEISQREANLSSRETALSAPPQAAQSAALSNQKDRAMRAISKVAGVKSAGAYPSAATGGTPPQPSVKLQEPPATAQPTKSDAPAVQPTQAGKPEPASPASTAPSIGPSTAATVPEPPKPIGERTFASGDEYLKALGTERGLDTSGLKAKRRSDGTYNVDVMNSDEDAYERYHRSNLSAQGYSPGQLAAYDAQRAATQDQRASNPFLAQVKGWGSALATAPVIGTFAAPLMDVKNSYREKAVTDAANMLRAEGRGAEADHLLAAQANRRKHTYSGKLMGNTEMMGRGFVNGLSDAATGAAAFAVDPVYMATALASGAHGAFNTYVLDNPNAESFVPTSLWGRTGYNPAQAIMDFGAKNLNMSYTDTWADTSHLSERDRKALAFAGQSASIIPQVLTGGAVGNVIGRGSAAARAFNTAKLPGMMSKPLNAGVRAAEFVGKQAVPYADTAGVAIGGGARNIAKITAGQIPEVSGMAIGAREVMNNNTDYKTEAELLAEADKLGKKTYENLYGADQRGVLSSAIPNINRLNYGANPGQYGEYINVGTDDDPTGEFRRKYTLPNMRAYAANALPSMGINYLSQFLGGTADPNAFLSNYRPTTRRMTAGEQLMNLNA